MRRRDFLKLVAVTPLAGLTGKEKSAPASDAIIMGTVGGQFGCLPQIDSEPVTQHCIWQDFYVWSRDEFVFWRPIDETESATYIRLCTTDKPRALMPICNSIYWYGHRETWRLLWVGGMVEFTVCGPEKPISIESINWVSREY